MSKRLLLSLTTVILTVAGLTGATLAFFSQGKVLAGNTFAVGSVDIGGFNYANINLSNLAPGETRTITNFGVNYTGTLNADLYLGATGTSSPGDPQYIADHLTVTIRRQGTSTVVWTGTADYLSTHWLEIANNVTTGWQAYDVDFTLAADIPNFHEGQTNTDTKFLFYAVQTGNGAPATVPYLTDTSDTTIWK